MGLTHESSEDTLPLAPGFPTSLAEYVQVWCADLLVSLTPEQRDDLVQGLAMMDEGGPWLSRLSIQRLAEQRSGRYGDSDVFLGDLLEREIGGITPAERESILTSAVAWPVLPEPIPAPPEYPPIPADHPESWAEKLERDPPYTAAEPT
jgi:hypothetical protein